MFFRFFDFLSGWEKAVAKVVPEKLIDVSKQFIRGSKGLLGDMRDFIWIYNLLSSTSSYKKACKTLTARQLSLYLRLPREMIRVAPFIVVSALPMAQHVTFPVALMFPKVGGKWI